MPHCGPTPLLVVPVAVIARFPLNLRPCAGAWLISDNQLAARQANEQDRVFIGPPHQMNRATRVGKIRKSASQCAVVAVKFGKDTPRPASAG
jgi:hypothetical protein